MESTTIVHFINKFIVTGCFLGYTPKAPGTIGSVGGLISWFFLTSILSTLVLSATLIIVALLALVSIAQILKTTSDKDPHYIVIDEVVGVWIACFTLTPTNSWITWLSAFLLFRFFDIKKPWIIGKADKLPGEVGVMADDILAGFFTLVIVTTIQFSLAFS